MWLVFHDVVLSLNNSQCSTKHSLGLKFYSIYIYICCTLYWVVLGTPMDLIFRTHIQHNLNSELISSVRPVSSLTYFANFFSRMRNPIRTDCSIPISGDFRCPNLSWWDSFWSCQSSARPAGSVTLSATETPRSFGTFEFHWPNDIGCWHYNA